MAAEPVPQPSPPNKQRDLITKFRDDYGVALAEATISAEHTATDGWKRLYADQRTRRMKARVALAARLKSMAETMESQGFTEDDEKALSDLKKESAELRERGEGFERDTIGPVIASVRECERILMEAKSAAQREESIAPLTSAGLEHLMQEAAAKVHRPVWDADTGTVRILDPASDN